MIGEITLPFQSNGSLLILDGKVVGSKLIAQEFKSDKFFHPRPVRVLLLEWTLILPPKMLIPRFLVSAGQLDLK